MPLARPAPQTSCCCCCCGFCLASLRISLCALDPDAAAAAAAAAAERDALLLPLRLLLCRMCVRIFCTAYDAAAAVAISS